MCVHVFCAGYTGWMGWLRWAGFLCGPPANFMIYSAKGRGARPPVTTERELHVGLMISPQKCLLWLGLHAARSPPTGWMAEREEGLKRELGWSAWVNTIACHDTFTWGGLWRKRRRGRAGRCIWPSCWTCFKLPSLNKYLWFLCVCVFCEPITFLPFISLESQCEISEATLKRGHGGWCNRTLTSREWGWNTGMGCWLWAIFDTFFPAGLLAGEGWLLRTWIWMLRMVLLLSVPGWLRIPLNWMMSSAGICEHSWQRDKITGVSLITLPECEQVRELRH